MEWKLFADLSEIAGGRTVDVDVDADGETEMIVREALDALLAAHPALEDRVMEDGDLSSHINVLKNGTDVRNAAGLDTPVEEDDELALFPPVSGGGS